MWTPSRRHRYSITLPDLGGVGRCSSASVCAAGAAPSNELLRVGLRPGWPGRLSPFSARDGRRTALRGSADRQRVGAPAVAPVDEFGGDEDRDGEGELGQAVDGAAVGVAAEFGRSSTAMSWSV